MKRRLTPVSGADAQGAAPSAEELAAQATEQWRHDVQVAARTAAGQLDTWFDQTGWSQGQASRVLNAYLDGISGRKVSPPTFSRFRREPMHLVHATLGVLMTMAHVYGHTLTDLAQRIDAAIERERYSGTRAARTMAQQRAAQRAAEEQRVADLLTHLSDNQLHDAGVYFGTLARENMAIRAEMLEQQGMPLDADVPNLEVDASGRAAQRELAAWADEQRAQDKPRGAHSNQPG